MKRMILWLGFLLALSACSDASNTPKEKTSSASATSEPVCELSCICEKVRKEYDAKQPSGAAPVLEKHSDGKAHWINNQLIIKTAGKDVSFKSYTNVDECNMIFDYVRYTSDIGYHLIRVSYYEGGDYILVSQASGERVVMGETPYLSPSRTWIVSAETSEAHGNDVVTIWKVSPERLLEEFRYEPKEYAHYKFVAWEGDSVIRFKNFTAARKPYCSQAGQMMTRESLRFENGKWVMSVDSDEKTTECKPQQE